MYVCGAQVGNPHVSGARKKNVFGLEIAVHDAHIVKSVEAECLEETFKPKIGQTRARASQIAEWRTHDLSCPPP